MKSCNECIYVSLTEKEQRDNRVDHVCIKHEARVRHWSASLLASFLYPCKQCKGKDFKQR